MSDVGNPTTERGLETSVARVFAAILLAGLLLFAVLSFMAFKQYRLSTEHMRDVELSTQTRYVVAQIGQALFQMESEQRGFLLTQNPDYLPNFRTSRERIDFLKSELTTLNAQHERRQTRLEPMFTTLDAKMNELEDTVRLAEAGRRDQALEIVNTDIGRDFTETLRAQAAEIRKKERAHETEARNDFARAQRNLGSLALAALLSGLGLVVLTLALLRRNASLLAREQRQTEQAVDGQDRAKHEQERVETLLEEMNHRIGNSLGMVSALLGLQRTRSKSDDVRDALDAARSRIHAVATAHRRLRLAPDMETTDLAPVLADMAGDLRQSQPRQDIDLDTDFVNADVSDRDAVTLGLLMSELVINAFKHAFVGRDGGTVWAETYFDEDAVFVLRVQDDGVGMPKGADGDSPVIEGLGASVVARLSRQFGGELDYAERTGGGTCIAVLMPKLKVVAKP